MESAGYSAFFCCENGFAAVARRIVLSVLTGETVASIAKVRKFIKFSCTDGGKNSKNHRYTVIFHK